MNKFKLRADALTKQFKIEVDGLKELKLSISSDEKVNIDIIGENDELLYNSSFFSLNEHFDSARLENIVRNNSVISAIIYLEHHRLTANVEINIEPIYSEYIVLKGDFHAHTLCSTDGTYMPSEQIEIAKSLGMDFCSVTDHNSMAANFNNPEDFIVIPGIELTNKYGHCNFLGKKHPVEDVAVENYLDQLNKITEARKNGALFSANHPFSPKSRGWMLPLDNPKPDVVEIWNGPWEIHNRIALEWWKTNLQNGNYIPAIGGSDFHNYEEGKNLNIPVNNIYTRAKTVNNIIYAASKGRNIITDEYYDVKFYSGSAVSGETTSKNHVTFELEWPYGPAVLEIVRSNSTEYVDFDSNIKLDIDFAESNFVAVLVADSHKRDRKYKIITNPIFFIGGTNE